MKLNKITRLLAGASILILAFILAACGSNPLTGKWENTDMGMAVALEFRGDGSFSVSTFGISVNGRYVVNGASVTMSLDTVAAGLPIGSGTSSFSVSGNKLTLDGIVFTRK